MAKRKKRALLENVLLSGKFIVVNSFKGLGWIAKKSASGVKQGVKKHKKKSFEKKSIKERSNAKYDEFKEVNNINGEYGSFEDKLKRTSVIGIILGARGTGKSAIGLRILENIVAKTNKNAYAMGFKQESLPSWIKVVEDIDQVKNNSIILVDEGGITFNSRNSMSEMNKMLSEILLVARHKDLSVLFISQNSSNLEINAIRQADFLLLKPSSLLQRDFERKKIKEIYNDVDELFEQFKDVKGLSYIYSDNFRGFVENSLPSFWSENVSKAFK